MRWEGGPRGSQDRSPPSRLIHINYPGTPSTRSNGKMKKSVDGKVGGKKRKQETSKGSYSYKSTRESSDSSTNTTSSSGSSKHSEYAKLASTVPRKGARLEAKKLIYQSTGKTPRQIASKCFEMGQKFHNMKWRSQMNIALKCSINFLENNRSGARVS